MIRFSRIVVLAVLLLLPALPALAAPLVSDSIAISVSAPQLDVSQAEPAVEIDLFKEEERPDQAWTFWVLLPAALGLGIVTVIVSALLYFPKVVMKRYQTVD